MAVIEGFSDGIAQVNGVDIAYSWGGAGAPVLLLHGFPQTRALWAQVAPVLAKSRRVICADLRGYGASSKPANVAAYSFREMGRDMVALMAALGHDRFDLVGHDRGGRCAHRMALDAPGRVKSLTVMDIVPTHLLLDELRWPVAKGYYHWFFLAQPEPFPERLIGADPDYFFESCLLGWGAARLGDFDPVQLAAYRAAWRDPETIRGMCNDYRAALEVDFALDAADLVRRVSCPTLVMWGADGAMARAYDVPGTWGRRCSDITARALPGGHFFIDTSPAETAAALSDFLG
jgi:haloacetate dehalogenase